MAIIENFATINYTSNGISETVTSNVAEIGLNSAITLTKYILGDTYGEDSVLTYMLSVTNTSTSAINGINITDNLGTFTSGTLELTPLNYTAPALLLIDGIDNSAQLTVNDTESNEVTFSFPTLSSGSTANIVYRATVNEYAPLAVDSVITNTAVLESDSDCAEGTASATVTVERSANVSVFKQMCPNPVVCGDTVTYTIRVYNYGNIPAENVQLIDNFDPAPTDITVSLNGALLPGSEYSYVNGTLTTPVGTGTPVTVPAATFTTAPDTGVVTVIPGIAEYVITGTI